MLLVTGALRRAPTLTSREFNQDRGRAKRAAAEGPVFITERGRPSVVLLSFEDWSALAGGGASIAAAMFLSAVSLHELEAVALRSATLLVPDPAPHRDAFIAATAMVHGLTVVTRNVSDFERFARRNRGPTVLNPWS